MGFDATSLRNVVQRLGAGLSRHLAEPADEQLRDGLVQRFEFTYELSHRMLRRYLTQMAASPDEVAHLAFADVIRVGNAEGLLRSGWPDWRRFREMRARTSHTYDANTALQVAAIPAFLEEAEHLCAEPERRLG